MCLQKLFLTHKVGVPWRWLTDVSTETLQIRQGPDVRTPAHHDTALFNRPTLYLCQQKIDPTDPKQVVEWPVPLASRPFSQSINRPATDTNAIVLLDLATHTGHLHLGSSHYLRFILQRTWNRNVIHRRHVSLMACVKARNLSKQRDGKLLRINTGFLVSFPRERQGR